MDPLISTLAAVAVLVVLLVIRVPVGLALLASGAVGIFMIDGASVAEITMARTSYSTTAKFVLVVIPYFLAMGVFIKNSPVPEDLFALGQRYLGWLPGGLAIATIMACGGFAAISGSSIATVVSVGRIAMREMRRFGYSKRVAAGVVGAAGTLGILIPPSVQLVLYGIITGESIGMLLIAGIIPGVISGVLYSTAIILRAVHRPEAFGRVSEGRTSATVQPAAPAPWLDGGGSSHALRAGDQYGEPGQGGAVEENLPKSSEEPASSAGVLEHPNRAPVRSFVEIAALFAVVVGGLYAGLLTVVEAAAAGAAMSLLIFLFERRRDTDKSALQSIRESLLETTELNSMVFMLLIGSAVFTFFLVSAGVPSSVAEYMVGLEVPAAALVVLLLLMFIPLGMFLDPMSMLLIAVPIAYPVVIALGYNGIWFGILAIKMQELALITPPFGLNAYVLAGIEEDVSVDDAFAGVLWFAPIDVVTIALLFAVPTLTTWLPSLMA